MNLTWSLIGKLKYILGIRIISKVTSKPWSPEKILYLGGIFFNFFLPEGSFFQLRVTNQLTNKLKNIGRRFSFGRPKKKFL